MKAVLDTKPDSIYNDDIAYRYHFPSSYLTALKQCIGDWIVYRRTRAGGGDMAYFAAGRVTHIDPDPDVSNLHYAYIKNFMLFDTPVPWTRDGRYAESALREVQEPWQIGARMRDNSVRLLEDRDFSEIVLLGLSRTLAKENAILLGLDDRSVDEQTNALLRGDAVPAERKVAQLLVNKKVRDARFRDAVCTAYGNRCAVTRLQLINGGGRAEVQAAHILPVEHGGPDIIQNAIALSATAHWLFDRHLISIGEDYRLLVSHNKVPSEFRNLFPAEGDQIHLPNEKLHWPSQKYLEQHRERFAAG